MDANEDLRKHNTDESALQEVRRSHHLQLHFSNNNKAYTWSKSAKNINTQRGYLDYILTKNVEVNQLNNILDELGNSDHKPLQVLVKFKGILVKRILSDVNRKMLQQHVWKYVENFNEKFEVANPAKDPCKIYNECA